MTLVYRDKMQTLLGDYAVGGPDCLVDPSLVQVAQDYRRRAQARMKPLAPEDLAKLPPAEYHVSLKIDGEFNLLVYQDGEAILVNPGGTVRAGLPCVDRIARILDGGTKPYLYFPGEFYYGRRDSLRPRVHDVTRVARAPQTADEVADLQFAAFDCLHDGADISFKGNWAFIDGRLPAPQATWVNSAEMIRGLFQLLVVQDGNEGIVIRSDTAGSFKVKPKHTIDAVVIGFTLDPDDPGRLHDLLVALMRPDGCYQVLGRVGGGFTDQDRRDWACDLKDEVAEADYTEVNDGLAYHFVPPRKVIEISCLDLISQSTRGQPIQQACLEWNFALRAGTWKLVRKLPLAAMISPQFVRRREDKVAVACDGRGSEDIRLSQVTDLVEVPMAQADARQFELPKSEVLKRQVWTKEQGDKEMVRKLVMYATHKAAGDYQAGLGRDWPAFVIAITDYSSGRKEPLDRDVRVSDSREQIERMWNELVLEKGGVKGWTPA